MTADDIRGWVRWAYESGISTVRFTGGEPTLHPALHDMCRLGRSLGLNVVLNTNGLGPWRLFEQLLPDVTLIKLSLPSCDTEWLTRETGVADALDRKLNVLRLATEAGVAVDILTVMVPENIGRGADFLYLIKPFKNANWSPLRVEPSPSQLRPISRTQIQALARELLWVGSDPGRPRVRLGLATPFCAVDPIEIGAAVFSGRAESCGPFQSLSVNADSLAMRCYSQREPLASAGPGVTLSTLLDAAKIERPLPARCMDCEFLARCQGGCRCALALENRNGEWCDYLMPA